MRKVTREACAAFNNGEKYNSTNTSVVIMPDGMINLLLHGNVIARRFRDWPVNRYIISMCGWGSNTTRERLNGLPGVSIGQHKGRQNWLTWSEDNKVTREEIDPYASYMVQDGRIIKDF